jgi:hypothetical protein
MQLIQVLAVLLLVVIGAAGFMSWDRRSGTDRRQSTRGGRRTADGANAQITEQPTTQ